MPRQRRLAGWILIAGINVLVLLGLFFGLTEWFIARKARTTLIYRPSRRFHHELLPNQRYERDGFAYRIGSHGLRGEPPPAKKTGRRLFVLGGSSAFDFRVKTSWPERLGQHLGVEAYNAGIPGYSLREIVPFYEDRIRRFRPDVVLIYVGWNDVKYLSASRHALTLPDYPAADGPPPRQYDFLRAPRPLRNLRALPVMFEKLRLRAGIVQENDGPARRNTSSPERFRSAVDWRQTPGFAFFRQRLHRLLDLVEADGAVPILVVEATLAAPDLPAAERSRVVLSYVRLSYEELLRVNDALAEELEAVAKDRKLPFVDVRSRMNGRAAYFHDHVHLTKEGSRALAEAVGDALVRIGIDRGRPSGSQSVR